VVKQHSARNPQFREFSADASTLDDNGRHQLAEDRTGTSLAPRQQTDEESNHD